MSLVQLTNETEALSGNIVTSISYGYSRLQANFSHQMLLNL
jgi:hypothetical protein